MDQQPSTCANRPANASRRMPVHSQAKIAALRDAVLLNEGRAVPKNPLTFYLEVSNVCNLQCTFCASFSAINPKRYQALRAEERGFLDADAIGNNLKSVLPSALLCYLFGFGEPTLHRQFPELIRFMGDHEVMVEFVTNGMHLTEELCQILVANKVYKITLSFSGATREEYENIYLGGEFDKVLSGMAALKAAKEAEKSKYPIVATNTIAMPHVVEKLPDFVDLVGARGVNIIQLFGLAVHVPELYAYSAVYNPAKHQQIFSEAFRRAERHGLILSVDNFVRQSADNPADERAVKLSRLGSGLTAPQVEGELLQIGVGSMKKYARERKANSIVAEEVRRPADPSADALRLDEARLRISHVHPPNREHFYCMEPFRTLYVRRDGRTKPCCLWPADDEHFGSLARQDGHDVWNNESLTATRRAIVQGLYPGNCHFCVKSQFAPDSPQLDLIQGYIDWYREAYGVTLPVTPPILHGSEAIISALAGLEEFQKPVLQAGTPADPYGRAAFTAPLPQQKSWPKLRESWRKLCNILSRRASIAPPPQSSIIGYIDSMGPNGISGWFVEQDNPKSRLKLDVYINGQRVGTSLAMIYRQDLVDHKIGDGCHGFYLSGDLIPRGTALESWIEIPERNYRSPTYHWPAIARIAA